MWKALIKWVESWSWRCYHNWTLERDMKTYLHQTDKMPHTTVVTYRCTKCCEFKSKKL